MRLKLQRNRDKGMTVVEVLVIVIVVAIMAGLLVPTSHHPSASKRSQAKTEINGLMAAISQYETTYSKLPGTASNQSSNFTFGTFGTSAAKIGITNATGPQANNSEIMAALLDLTNFPDGKPTRNVNHLQNPQQTSFLNINMNGSTNSDGLGQDGVYRDPWGNPYIITISYSSTNRCRDAFYRLASVSENNSDESGINGLIRPTLPPYMNNESRDSFEYTGSVMIWSLGEDGKADPNQKANNGVNRDNLLSW